MNPTTKDRFKRRHQRIYGTMRSIGKSIQKAKHDRKALAASDITHSEPVKADTPLAMITTSHHSPRLNLIFANFNHRLVKQNSEFLTLATKFATTHDYHLRIIARNNLPNPKLYLDFLQQHQLTAPSQYSFYTDSATRLAPPVHRLEVSPNDVFFTTFELDQLKGYLHDHDQ